MAPTIGHEGTWPAHGILQRDIACKSSRRNYRHAHGWCRGQVDEQVTDVEHVHHPFQIGATAGGGESIEARGSGNHIRWNLREPETRVVVGSRGVVKKSGAGLAGNRERGDLAHPADQARPLPRWRRQRLQQSRNRAHHLARNGHVNRPVMLDQVHHQREQQERPGPTAEPAMAGEQHRQRHQGGHHGGGQTPSQHLGEHGRAVHRLVGSLARAGDCGQEVSASQSRQAQPDRETGGHRRAQQRPGLAR